MKQWTIPVLLVALFYHVNSHGQSPDEFLNFTYPLPMCAKEFGTPKTVTLNQGEFQNQEFLVYLDREGILYGDVTGDGIDEALVPLYCGYYGANYTYMELLIYTRKDGRLESLTELNEQHFKDDYKRYYPDSILWSEVGDITTTNQTLIIVKPADGAHCCPQYDVTLKYRWEGQHFVITGKPTRQPLATTQ